MDARKTRDREKGYKIYIHTCITMSIYYNKKNYRHQNMLHALVHSTSKLLSQRNHPIPITIGVLFNLLPQRINLNGCLPNQL